MSEETSFEESLDETGLSVSSNESANIETNTSVSSSESLVEEGSESGQKKESVDLFKSESDVDTTASESYLEDIEADDSASSIVKESIENVFEVEETEQDETECDYKTFDNVKQIDVVSTKSHQSTVEALKLDSSTSSFSKKFIGDVLDEEIEQGTENDLKSLANTKSKSNPLIIAGIESEQLTEEALKTNSSSSSSEKGFAEDLFDDDATGNLSFSNIEQNTTVSTKFPKLPKEVLKTDSTSSLEKVSVENSIDDGTDKQDGTGNKSNSAAGNKSQLSPTEAMKALSISGSPTSGNKNTPRQSRFRARTLNIFDSPYNTRLKARMIRERELRSQSEGRSTSE